MLLENEGDDTTERWRLAEATALGAVVGLRTRGLLESSQVVALVGITVGSDAVGPEALDEAFASVFLGRAVTAEHLVLRGFIRRALSARQNAQGSAVQAPPPSLAG